MENVSVIVATFGNRTHWDLMAQRAIDSVLDQDPAPLELVRSHGPTLMDARNDGARKANGKWLCFLDADDELEEGYIGAMLECKADLRYPLVRYIDVKRPDIIPAPVELQQRHLLTGNFMVIGTLVRKDMFFNVGGFRDWPMYEDWDLWIRCWLAGAQIEPCRGAVYRVYRSMEGRNFGTSATMQHYFDAISNMHRNEAKEKGLL